MTDHWKARNRHPWPTDGITKKQLDKQTDRLDRLHDLNLKKIRSLKAETTALYRRIDNLERALTENEADRKQR